MCLSEWKGAWLWKCQPIKAIPIDRTLHGPPTLVSALDSQQPVCNPQKETQATFVRPTSPPLPSLTSFGASLFAPAVSSACTTLRCPLYAATYSGVAPFCGARRRISTRYCAPLGLRQRAPLCAQTNVVKKPHRARTWKAFRFVGRGGSSPLHRRLDAHIHRTRGLFTSEKYE